MPEYALIVNVANQILKKHYLCDQCLGRLFARKLRLSSNRLLGKKLNKQLDKKQQTSKCYICKNLFDNLDCYVKMMLESSLKFSFSTFSVGAILKPSTVDRDDAIRSEFRLRGVDSVKTDVTKQLAKSFAKKTRKTLDPLDSDITLVVNIKDESCQLRSKSILLSGRYTKVSRGLAQKQKSCSNCAGKGCRTCNFHGISEFDSVEGAVSELLFEKIGCTTAKFTWVGSEDKSSLVLGSGRPFFVKLQNPLKRKIHSSSISTSTTKNTPVTIKNLRVVTGLPPQPIRFSLKIEIEISSDSKISSASLKKLRTLTSTPVVVYEKSGKRTEKRIRSLSFQRLSDQEFKLKIDADGGLPIRRFVNGDDVVPSISSVVGTNCNAKLFDFLDVQTQ